VVSRDITALTYCENAHKKGLDRILAAWAIARRDGEELVVTGPSEPSHESSVRYTGMLAPDEYRTLLRRARVYVTAPRREDHGIAQLEALADGAQLVTTSAPGAYPALAMARDLDPRLVAEDPDDPWALAAALRAALDGGQASYSARAALALVPYTSAVIDEVVARSLLPCLLRR
jgi:hypothetical protein